MKRNPHIIVQQVCSTYGYSMSYVPEDVEQWPWELEQKGGSNDI